MSLRFQLSTLPSLQTERAWYLLTVLLRLGRPACTAELAFRSALDSISLSQCLVEFLCKIPGSPISVGEDRLVTVSGLAAAVLDRFVDRTVRLFVPRVLIRGSEVRREWSEFRLMSARKRKVGAAEDELAGPSAKRRLLWSSERDVEEVREDDQLAIHNSSSEAVIHINVADNLANGLSTSFCSNLLSQALFLSSSIPNDNSLVSSVERKDDYYLNRDGESEQRDNGQKMIVAQELPGELQPIVVQNELYNNTQAIAIHQDFLDGYDGSLSFEHKTFIFGSDTAERLNMSEHDTRLSLSDQAKDKPVFWMETLGEDSCIIPAAPLSVRYKVNPASSFFAGLENDSNEPFREIGSLTDQLVHNRNEEVTKISCCETADVSYQTDASGREQGKSGIKGVEHAVPNLKSFGATLSAEPGTTWKQEKAYFEKQKIIGGIASTVGFQRSVQESNTVKNDNCTNLQQDKRNDEKGTSLKQRIRKNRTLAMPSKDSRQETFANNSDINSEPKILPKFESFVIEEEEGSGGYGTVYRARRKEDGKVFAVKYPHPNAHSHHINNEMKMLERFGGRNFVIKYEGSFKCGQSECFVLEHVEHDRPEVLKKEIDVFELQWYGYCMFRSLASLHKQGTVHRDVKPGNFLFSRKLNKGYLIDFNLASDLQQKFSKTSRSENTANVKVDPFPPSIKKLPLYNQAGNVRDDRVLDNIRKEVVKDSRKVLFKNMKKGSSKGYFETIPSIDNSSKYGSQAPESGVTSAKDLTSTRALSAERTKQPIIPYKGRKELINFVNEAMQTPNHKEMNGPSSQRKRVAAPLGKMNNRPVMVTPMPLHSGGNAIAGAGMLNKGNGKHKREGPCVGTKGFRAPEVLFKSCHQSCKVDVWSAGVTLLYLIIGKTPFGGDPEQNIKEIAKLRGSEDLWEVAKLHNCEPSYPADLLDVQFLPSTGLRDWCKMNTKRPEFLDLVPLTLFDLVDKCLTVNPRCRITAQEALMHNFFAPCHESLKKQRLLRRAVGSDGTQTL